MGIYIKGMEMPKSCAYCRFLQSNGEIFKRELFCGLDSTNDIHGYKPNKGCPLVRVPPHGRLIDADELLERFNVLQKQKDMYGREVSSCFEDSGSLCTEWWCVEEIVADAPTVISADNQGGDA